MMGAEERNLLNLSSLDLLNLNSVDLLNLSSVDLLNLSSVDLLNLSSVDLLNLSRDLEQEDEFHVTPDLPEWVSKQNMDIVQVC